VAQTKGQDPLNLTGRWLGRRRYAVASAAPLLAKPKEAAGEIADMTIETNPLESVVERTPHAIVLGERRGHARASAARAAAIVAAWT
jgi:hypothetical protein